MLFKSQQGGDGKASDPYAGGVFKLYRDFLEFAMRVRYASIGVVLPGLRLVDASPSDESDSVLLPKRVDAAGKVLDLVLNRDGYVDSRHG